MDTRTKILTAAVAEAALAKLAPGTRLVAAAGWFEVLQAAHCRRLAEAKQQGDCLVVLVYAGGGSRRTVVHESIRSQMAAALGVVDYVVVCSEAEAQALLSAWRPSATVDAEQAVEGDLFGDVLQRHRSA